MYIFVVSNKLWTAVEIRRWGDSLLISCLIDGVIPKGVNMRSDENGDRERICRWLRCSEEMT